MADVDVPDVNASSYSDPIYDRLEASKNWMARRWPLIVICALVVMVAVLVFRNMAQHTPVAASAQAFAEAEQAAADDGGEALKALINDQDIAVGFQVRAAVAAASLLAEDGKNDEALALLADVKDRAAKQSQIDGSAMLQLNVKLSKGAIFEQQGQWDDAIAIYDDVSVRAGAQAKAEAFAADLALARVYLAKADGQSGAEATATRELAKQVLEGRAQDQDNTGSRDLTRLAVFQLEKLKLEHPEVFGGEPLAQPEVPAAESKPTEDAPADVTSPSEEKAAE